MPTPRRCSIDGCDQLHRARGWCGPHYDRWRRYGDPQPDRPLEGRKICQIDGCDERHYARGWCQDHYVRWWAVQGETTDQGNDDRS